MPIKVNEPLWQMGGQSSIRNIPQLDLEQLQHVTEVPHSPSDTKDFKLTLNQYTS